MQEEQPLQVNGPFSLSMFVGILFVKISDSIVNIDIENLDGTGSISPFCF